jgi:hypothetical protein
VDIRSLVSAERYNSLMPHFVDENKEALFEEIDVDCNLQAEKDVVRCFDPVTMYLGDQPLLRSRIFERWHGETWADHADL